MNKSEYIEQYIRNMAKNNPSIFTEDLIQQAIKKFENDTDDLSKIEQKIDELSNRFIRRKQEEQFYLESMQQKFNNSEYINTSIKNLDISTLGYEQMEQFFFHYSWKKYLESYDKEGMKAVIGENSEGIDPEASIFFSKGVEGVLELWDVWLKWRLNRQNNPQFNGTTPEEIQATNKRFKTGQITDEERKKWYYWMDYFKNKKFLENPSMLERLFDYQFTEMINSDYLILDLRENEDFIYDQVDIKKQWAIEKAKETGRGIDPLTATQYGYYSDFSSPIVDKWNMQTIPGKNITIEPNRMSRLTIDGKTDVFSIMKYMYDKYQMEVPKEKQVKFDILDSYVKYVCAKKLGKETVSTEVENEESLNEFQEKKQLTQEPKEEPEFTTFQKKKEERQTQQQNINVMSQPKQEIHEQQKQVTEQHNQTRQMEKPKVKTLTKPINSSGGSSNGFVDTLILTLITGFVAGALFMIAYYIFK